MEVATTRRGVAALLEQQSAQLTRLAQAVRSHPTDDGVHDLRVLTRRLRVTLWLGARLCSASMLLRERRRLRRIGRLLGRRRMLDVVVRDAASYGLDGGLLMREQRIADAQIRAALAPAELRSARLGLVRVAEAILASSDDRLRRGLKQVVKQLQRAARRAATDKAAQHQLRIEVKKARYLIDALCGDGRGDFLRTLQDVLGRAHDLEVMQEALGQSQQARRDERRFAKDATRNLAEYIRRATELLLDLHPRTARRRAEQRPPQRRSPRQ